MRRSTLFTASRHFARCSDYLFQIAFPEPCLHCGANFPPQGILCKSCHAALLESVADMALPTAYYTTHYLFLYQGVVKSLFKAAKFSHRRRAIATLCSLAYPSLAALCTPGSVLVPMPSSRNFLSQLLEKSVPHERIYKGVFHIRQEFVGTQNKHLSEAARFRRIRQILYRSKKELPSATRYILCDDVLTTGATLGQAAALLEQNGIARDKILLWALCYRERWQEKA